MENGLSCIQTTPPTSSTGSQVYSPRELIQRQHQQDNMRAHAMFLRDKYGIPQMMADDDGLDD